MVQIHLHCRVQVTNNVIWDVLGKVIQSNAMFGLSDRIEVSLDHVSLTTGNGRFRRRGPHWTRLVQLKRVWLQ